MLGAFTLLCGLVLLGVWFVQTRDWFASARWDRVTGTVRGHLIEPSTNNDPIRPKDGFRPVIRYAYEVEGQTYVAARFSATQEPFMPTQDDADAFIERFPIGAKVAVKVDPANPRRALLERRLSGRDALPAYIAAGCFVFGTFLL